MFGLSDILARMAQDNNKETVMPEKPYCSMHQRNLRGDGSCIDCEKNELVMSYARDIVNAWPQMTLRTLGQMTKKIEALKEALELAKR